MGIIDIHAHTTNKELWNLHVKTASLSVLEELMEEHGIEKTVLMATYFPFKKSGIHNPYLFTRIKGNKKFLMFGSLDAMNDLEGGVRELESMAEEGVIVGIKLYPGYQDFRAEKLFSVYELAEKYSLPVAFHSGELHGCCPKDDHGTREKRCGRICWIEKLGDLARPGELARAAKKFPRVNFIFAHLSNPFFDELREAMKECPNIYTDISGQYVTGSKEDTPEYKQEIIGEIKKFLALENGIDRLLFATDFPIQSHADSIALVKALGLTHDEEQKIFFENAKKLLKL